MAVEDLASVGFSVDSSELKKGTNAVKGFTKSATDAAGGTKKFNSAVDAANDNIMGMSRSSVKANRSMNTIAATMRMVSLQAGAMGAAISAAFSIKDLIMFKDALAEVSTLVDTATFDMASLEKSAISQSQAFGGSATAQAKAFYQIISAGADTAAKANEILLASNKLAVGGVTSVTTAADGLTSVMNAYGSKVESAAAVSDALFVAMRAGKTTIGELSTSLGSVAPLAAQTNVGFDELVGSISALTKGGIATSEAVTGIRAILAAVAKPTKEARDLSHELGIEFNSAGLAAKGFQGFLNDLVAKTGGSTDMLAQLFGGVEALVPAMALSGQAGKDFAAIMEQMAGKAGETQVAFDKMANSPGFQAGRVWSSLKAEVLDAASGMSGPLTSGLKFVADNMGTAVDMAKVLGVVLLVTFSQTLVGYVIALSLAIGTTLVGSITSLTSAVAANPLGLMAVGAVALGKVIYDNRQQIMEFIGLVDHSAAAAAASMAASSSKAQGMVNGLKEAESKYQAAIKGTSGTQTQASAANLSNMSKEIAKKKEQIALELQHQKAMQATLQAQIESVGRQLRTDVAGKYFNNRNLYAEGYADRKVGRLTQVPIGKLTETLESSKYFSQMQQLQSGATAAENSIRLLEEALNSTFTSSTKEVEATSAAFVDLGGKATKAVEKVGEKAREGVNLLRSVGDAASSSISGFLNDLSQGVSAAEALGNAFRSLGSSLINIASQNLMQQILGPLTAGGGAGGWAGIFSTLLSVLPFANGGAFGAGGVQAFANGGAFTNSVVSRPTLFKFANGTGMMGEAGPEAIMPLQRDSKGRLGVTMSGGGTGTQVVAPSLNVSIENNGTSKEFDVQQLSEGEIRIIANDEIRKNAPSVVASDLSNPNGRVSKSLTKNTNTQRKR